MESKVKIRKIEKSDNEKISEIIREVLIEFGGKRPGTAYYDFDTDHMYEAFLGKRQAYFVAELNGNILGGSGIKELKGSDTEICELQKLYLLSSARGIGIGRTLTEKCIEFAGEQGYQKCYLETFPNMLEAIHLYEKMDFKRLDSPIGDTGHGGCDVWMIKYL